MHRMTYQSWHSVTIWNTFNFKLHIFQPPLSISYHILRSSHHGVFHMILTNHIAWRFLFVTFFHMRSPQMLYISVVWRRHLTVETCSHCKWIASAIKFCVRRYQHNIKNLDLHRYGYGPGVGSCEYGNESYCSIETGECGYLSDNYLLVRTTLLHWVSL
jgi:hypothetical protein